MFPLSATAFRGLLVACLSAAVLSACADGSRATGLTASSSLVTTSASTATGIQFVPLNLPIDLTPDGSLALLEDGRSREVDLYFYETRTGKLELKAHAGDPQFDFATGISAGGRISATHRAQAQAGLWSEATGWLDLGSPYTAGCPGAGDASAWDVSADGHVAVGLAWNGCNAEAFRWTDATGPGVFTKLQLLGSRPGGPPANRATVVSDDGRVAAGWAAKTPVDRWPAVWRADGHGMLLPILPGATEDAPGEVLSISADGRMVAGTWNSDAFYWTTSTGTVNIGKLRTALPTDPTFANAIAADGKLIFGGCGDPIFGVPVAFVWTAAEGMRSLQNVAASHGIVIPAGYVLTSVMAASADGSILLGVAYDPSFNQVSFVMRLPTRAYGV
ncbi:MAG: hypothetical protein U0132_17980 [Gemmatimonadaceae bacterium]